MIRSLALVAVLATPALAQNWPTWRGPTDNNLAAVDATPPLEWSFQH